MFLGLYGLEWALSVQVGTSLLVLIASLDSKGFPSVDDEEFFPVLLFVFTCGIGFLSFFLYPTKWALLPGVLFSMYTYWFANSFNVENKKEEFIASLTFLAFFVLSFFYASVPDESLFRRLFPASSESAPQSAPAATVPAPTVTSSSGNFLDSLMIWLPKITLIVVCLFALLAVIYWTIHWFFPAIRPHAEKIIAGIIISVVSTILSTGVAYYFFGSPETTSFIGVATALFAFYLTQQQA